MKDLESYGVVEMTQQEMLTVEGGSWLSSAWNGIKTAAVAVADAVADAAVWVYEHVNFSVIPSGETRRG